MADRFSVNANFRLNLPHSPYFTKTIVRFRPSACYSLGEMTDLSHTRAWQLEALLASARTSTAFASDFGQIFASIPVQLEGNQVVPLHSNSYRNWLLARFQTEHAVVPRPSALRAVVESLEAQAEFPPEPENTVTPRPAIARRIASRPGQVLIDLHNAQGESVEITAAGWRITQNLAGFFRATRSASPLPPPERTTRKPLKQFQTLLGLSPEQFKRCLSWLIAAMSPTGPYPILVLQGASSSAKSTIASMLRAVLDPGPAPFCPLPSGARDLQSLASHNWILALDNVDLLPSATLRKLIRLSTGMVFAVRDKPSDPEPFQVHLERPMLFTTETALRIGDRAIAIHLPPEAAPISQAEFEQLRPQLLGALCTAVSSILAGNPAPGWQEFTGAPDPIASAVAAFMQSQTEWTGTATELLLRLRASHPTLGWPETPKGLTQLLRRTALNNIDFQSRQNSNGTRSLILTKITIQAETSADAQQPVRVEQAFLPATAPSTRNRTAAAPRYTTFIHNKISKPKSSSAPTSTRAKSTKQKWRETTAEPSENK